MLNTSLLLLFLATSQPERAEASSLPVAAPQPDAPQPAKKRKARPAGDEDDDDGEWVEVTHEPGFLDLFTEETIRYTGQSFREHSFKYRLFVPETSAPEDKRPLIVWLHGKGEAGVDNSSHLRHLGALIFTRPWRRERYPFFLLAVQCPRENPVWTASGDAEFDMLDVVSAALDKTLAEHAIDRERITLGGISSGGSGAWELAMRQPERFAAVAPLASGGGNESRLNRITHLPVWTFHSTKDPGTSVEGVRKSVSELQAAGGNVHLTEVNLRMHDCWHAAFEQYELLPWLLAQKRGDPASPPPGTLSTEAKLRLAWKFLSTNWTPAQLAGQIGIPLVLVVAIWSTRRQKRLRRSRKPSGTRNDGTEDREGNEGNRKAN